MTTEELLKQPLSVASSDPDEVQRHIDAVLAQLAQLRQLLNIAKAGPQAGTKEPGAEAAVRSSAVGERQRVLAKSFSQKSGEKAAADLLPRGML